MPTEALEAARILGLIVLVWFGLVGWKLVPMVRTHKPTAIESKLGDH